MLHTPDVALTQHESAGRRRYGITTFLPLAKGQRAAPGSDTPADIINYNSCMHLSFSGQVKAGEIQQKYKI